MMAEDNAENVMKELRRKQVNHEDRENVMTPDTIRGILQKN